MSVRAIEIFRAGTHETVNGPATITPEQLAHAAAAYDPEKYRAPLTIGHPPDDQPRMGDVLTLVLRGIRLFALADVGEALINMVRARSLRDVSASFFGPNAPGNPTPGVFALKHVGVLVGQAPAVKGMEPLAFAAPQLFFDFAAPLNSAVASDRIAHYEIARSLQRACPSMSFIDCARHAERALQAKGAPCSIR